jgi:hypothetical protein
MKGTPYPSKRLTKKLREILSNMPEYLDSDQVNACNVFLEVFKTEIKAAKMAEQIERMEDISCSDRFERAELCLKLFGDTPEHREMIRKICVDKYAKPFKWRVK